MGQQQAKTTEIDVRYTVVEPLLIDTNMNCTSLNTTHLVKMTCPDEWRHACMSSNPYDAKHLQQGWRSLTSQYETFPVGYMRGTDLVNTLL